MQQTCVSLVSALVVSLATSAAVAADFEVGVAGSIRWGSQERRATSVILYVAVPLEPVVAGRPAEQSDALAHPDAKPDAGPRGGTPRAPAVGLVSPALARAAVRAALVASGQASARRRLRSLASRAKASAALPDVKVRAGRSTDESLRLSPTASDPNRFTQSGGYDLFFEGSLSWRLGRLVFARDEIAVERLRRQHAAARSRLAERVLSTLFRWQRAQIRLVDPSADDAERSSAVLDALEAEAMLDVLTAGWFGRAVRRRPDSAEEEAL